MMGRIHSHRAARTGYRWILALTTLALVLAACGGGESQAPEEDADAAAGGDGAGGGGEELSEEMQEAVAEAEELGLEFITSHEEIVACAEEEGALEAASSHDEDYDLIQDFEEQYPFLDVTLYDFSGRENRERFVLEAEAGQVPPYDVLSVPGELRRELGPLVQSYDVLGMAEAGVLDIPIEMIDDDLRTVVASGSTAGVFSYNEDAFTDTAMPTTWEDLLEPEFHSSTGFRMLGDTRLQNYAAMVGAWGIERTKEYYAEFATLDPTWVSGFSTHLVTMAQGESDGYPFVNLHSAYQQVNDYGSPLNYAFLEPIPIRLSEEHAVTSFDIAEHPCAGLLFVEWTATPGGQAAWESGDQPYQSSIFGEYEGGLKDLVEDTGMELSIADWDIMVDQQIHIEEVLEAAGFPQPEEG